MGRTGNLISFASIGQPRHSKVLENLELGGEVVHDDGGEAVGILGGHVVWQSQVWQSQVWQGIKCNTAAGADIYNSRQLWQLAHVHSTGATSCPPSLIPPHTIAIAEMFALPWLVDN